MKKPAADADFVWLSGIVEFSPIAPGSKVSVGGKMVRVFEVRKLRSLSSPIAGEQRALYAVLHAGFGSVLVAVVLEGVQREWSLFRRNGKVRVREQLDVGVVDYLLVERAPAPAAKGGGGI